MAKAMSQSYCVSKIIIPRVLVPCEEPPQLVDHVLKYWREALHQQQQQHHDQNPSGGGGGVDTADITKKKEITARLDEILTTATFGGTIHGTPSPPPVSSNDLFASTAAATTTTMGGGAVTTTERVLQLKFRNVIRVCVSAAVFREFTSTSVINTRTRDMGMMLMCIMNVSPGPFTTAETERWMKHDTVCPHAALIDDMHTPSEYSGLDGVYSANGQAEAVESMLVTAFVTDQNKAQRPSDLRVGVHKDNRRQLLVSGLEQFDVASATGRLREILVAEERLDMLHTLVFNLVFQEDTCTMHLFVSQLSTLNGEGDTLCDVLLQRHVRTCVSRLHNPGMEIVPIGSSGDPGKASSAYRDCMVRLPITIPNPINIGANVCTYIADKVFRYRSRKAARMADPSMRPY